MSGKTEKHLLEEKKVISPKVEKILLEGEEVIYSVKQRIEARAWTSIKAAIFVVVFGVIMMLVIFELVLEGDFPETETTIFLLAWLIWLLLWPEFMRRIKKASADDFIITNKRLLLVGNSWGAGTVDYSLRKINAVAVNEHNLQRGGFVHLAISGVGDVSLEMDAPHEFRKHLPTITK